MNFKASGNWVQIAFASFCFALVSDPDIVHSEYIAFKAKVRRKLMAMPTIFGRNVPELRNERKMGDDAGDTATPVSTSKSLDLKSWMTAASLTYNVQLESLVKLFEKDRCIGVMESCCFPSYIRAMILNPQSPVAAESQKVVNSESVRAGCR